MSDETKLPFGKHTPRKRRCLAWHSQCTWRVADGDKDIDVDLIRPPRLLQAYTAANCWDLLGEKNDPASLCPEGDALPEAMYHARLTATDSHAVNKLVSKFVASKKCPRTISTWRLIAHNIVQAPSVRKCLRGGVCYRPHFAWRLN